MHDVIKAKYISNYLIELQFSDMKKGIVDFQEYTKRSGLFEKLKDINFFQNFTINRELGTICWENGLDIAPETLYSKI